MSAKLWCPACSCYHKWKDHQIVKVITSSEPSPAFQGADESARRKTAPMATGCLDYFPAALWEVAQISYWGNEKHNPGEPLHDARGKSQDDADCLIRHLKDRGTWDELVLKDGRKVRVRHSAAVAWRALRILQRECEADGAPLARGARVPTTTNERT